MQRTSQTAGARDRPGGLTAPARAAAQRALQGPSRSLGEGTVDAPGRAAGVDWERVRIHDDASAHLAASALGARAFTYGDHVMFGRGQYAPETSAGRTLLHHELAHVSQQQGTAGQGPPRLVAAADSSFEVGARAASASGQLGAQTGPAPAPGTLMLDRDPNAGATYPTENQQSELNRVLNNDSYMAALLGKTGTGGAAMPAVDDPAQFRKDAKKRVIDVLDRKKDSPLDQARAIKSAPTIEGAVMTDLAQIAAEAILRVYGDDIRVGGTTITAAQLRDRVSFYSKPSHLPKDDVDALPGALVRTLLLTEFLSTLSSHNVDPDRDAALLQQAVDEIVAARRDDFKTMALFRVRGFADPNTRLAFVRRQIEPLDKPESDTAMHLRGRWEALKTIVHELLHTLAHKDYRAGTESVEALGAMTEGVTEHFAQKVFSDIMARAGEDADLWARIGGTAITRKVPNLSPDTYSRMTMTVDQLLDVFPGESGTRGEENLRAAYFKGQVEFLGLGTWNKEEAKKQEDARKPPKPQAPVKAPPALPDWDLGAALVLKTDFSTGMVRARVGRVMLGKEGPLKLDIGAGVSYLDPGHRVGGGADIQLRYEGNKLFVGGGVLLQGSLGFGSERLSDSIQLDALPRLMVGRRFGRVKAGFDVEVLIPLRGGAGNVERAAGVLAGFGASVAW